MLDLHDIPENTKVVISAKKCHFISHDIVELIRTFIDVIAKKKNIEVELLGFDRYGLGVDSESTPDSKPKTSATS